jgi:hypothetical protein
MTPMGLSAAADCSVKRIPCLEPTMPFVSGTFLEEVALNEDDTLGIKMAFVKYDQD